MADPAINVSIDGETGDVGAAFAGKLNAHVKERTDKLALGYRGAMDKVTTSAKERLRQDVMSGEFKNAAKLAKTWRSAVYPRGGRGSLEPAGLVYNKAATIIDVFTEGAVIRARNAEYLTIPTAAGKQLLERLNRPGNRTRTESGTFAREDNPVARVEQLLGRKLELRVGSRDAVLMLPPDGKGRTERSRRGVVYFILVKQAVLKPRMKGRRLFPEIEASFGGDFVSALAAQPGVEDTP